MEALEVTSNVPWKNIPLTGKKAMGRSFIVDVDDYKEMLNRNWYINSRGLVVTSNGKNSKGNCVVIAASHVVLGEVNRSTNIQYSDGDKLNLRKSNLKIVKLSAQGNLGGIAHHGVNFFVSKGSSGYVVNVAGKYRGCTGDLSKATFIADICLVRKMKSWNAALKRGLLNHPDRKDEIMEALRNGEDVRFLYGSKKKNSKSGYPYVSPCGDGFRGECKIEDVKFSTKTLQTAKEAALALYNLLVRRIGKKRAFKYTPLELILEKVKVPRQQRESTASTVQRSEVPKVSAPPVVPNGDQLPLATGEQIREVEEHLDRLIADLPPLPDEIAKTIERAAETIAKMIYEPSNAEKFIDRGPGYYIFDNADRIRELMEQIMGLGYFIGKMKPCVVVELKRV